jgi:RNA polymerase sigma factor (sigma-70 family)
MANPQLSAVLQRLRDLAERAPPAAATDGELLEAFRARGDQAAFAALVRRHGPMVLGVGRRMLRREQDAEDVFQATFLLLAQKAGSVRDREAVSGWLHGVAQRLAARARARAACRGEHERRAGTLRPTATAPQAAWGELQDVLDEALRQLPAKYRRPLVLCYLEGKSHEAAARELGCPVGTLGSWLLRGRRLLRDRLARRGLTLSAGALATALLANGAAAAVPRALSELTVREALRPGAAAELSRGLPGALAVPRRWLATALVAFAGAAALAYGLASAPGAVQPPAAAPQQPPAPPAQKAAAQPAAEPAPARPRGQMTVRGQVLGADGKPLAGATVVVAAGEVTDAFGWGARLGRPAVLGQARTGAEGRFRLTAPRTSSNSHYLVRLFAAAPGHGLCSVHLDPNAARQDVSLRLHRERVLRGRLIDLQGVAAARVRVSVEQVQELAPPHHSGSPLGAPAGLTFWPAAAQTDAQGRVELHGLGPEQKVTLGIADARFARQTFVATTPAGGAGAAFDWSVAGVQHLEGRVVYADTGRPVPHARWRVESLRARREGDLVQLAVQGRLDDRADGEGRFRINPYAGDRFFVTAFAPAGGPYLSYTQAVTWRKGAVKQTVELRLPRGILLRGTVKEAASGKPVAGARIYYHRRQSPDLFDTYREGFRAPAVSAADGTFRLAVLPVPATLLVRGPTPDYVPVATSSGELERGRPGGSRYYPDALQPLQLKPGTAKHEVAITLRRGVTVRGTLAGPDGKPVREAVMFSTRLVGPRFSTLGKGWRISDGTFEVSGCDPGKPVKVLFLAPGARLGAAVELPGKGAVGGRVTVRLQPCGSATVRLLDSKGKPLANHQPSVLLVLTPGAAVLGEPALDRKLGADVGYPPPELVPQSDAAGRLTVRHLIPGATYRLTDWPELYFRGKWRDFSVGPRQEQDLGDLAIPQPEN